LAFFNALFNTQSASNFKLCLFFRNRYRYIIGFAKWLFENFLYKFLYETKMAFINNRQMALTSLFTFMRKAIFVFVYWWPADLDRVKVRTQTTNRFGSLDDYDSIILSDQLGRAREREREVAQLQHGWKECFR
jgi:hypothetical protein